MAVSRAPASDSGSQRMVWLLPLVFCLGSGNEVSQSSLPPQPVNGILGESATFPLKLPAGKMIIVWNYRREASHVTTILIIRLHPSEKPQIIHPDPQRKERLNATESYSLLLRNLTMADTGQYSVQITTEDSKPVVFSYTLRVFERLSNLEVTNHTLLFENGTCQMHLACIVENPNSTVSVGWQASGNISLGGPNLTISWDPKNSSDQNYTCRAENAISNLSVSVSAQSLCKGILTNLYWNPQWLIITAIIIAVLVGVVIYVCMKRRGFLPLASQHADYPRNTDAPGSPGNTVYAQVIRPMQEMESSKSIKNDSMTIYSIVNQAREPISHGINTCKDIK
ncbi:SLAM family member 6 [Acomys russatus]|uniref:SLAM family member 6 n=1 Tax=Acomys russatus TaxID=60746 RepID=UPI0021E33D70|nr:SLAM family member 6 [Acomys russatus]